MVRVYRLPQRRRTGRCHDPEELAFAVRADAERRFPLILHRPALNPPNNVFRVGARPGRAAPQTPAPLLLGLLFPDTPPSVTCSLVHHSSPFIEPSRHRAPGIGEFNGVRCERRPIVEPELGPSPMAAWLQSPLMLSGAHHKCLTLVQYFCLAVASHTLLLVIAFGRYRCRLVSSFLPDAVQLVHLVRSSYCLTGTWRTTHELQSQVCNRTTLVPTRSARLST